MNKAAMAPVIETPRLRLRGHRLDDRAARMAYTAEPETMRFVGGCQNQEENAARILRYAGHWALHGRGPFAVEEKASGAMVGEIGIADFTRGLGPTFDGMPEALWILSSRVQGKGYAREAMEAALAWHDATFGPQRIVCIIAPDNAASLALAARLGFSFFSEADYKEHPVLLLERLP
jgi:RimJ/RimL family protein N-acetyltransferase